MNTNEEILQIEQQIENIKNFNIYVLGPPEAGKTTFIPCMYHELVYSSHETGFFLLMRDRNKATQLNQAYDVLAERHQWLPNTGSDEKPTWEFLCCVPRGDGTRRNVDEVVQFTYLDYAGGRVFQVLSQEEGGDGGELQNRIRQEADALLGLLDGKRILSLMRGEQDDAFAKELHLMCELMKSTPKPIYFLITQWDRLCRQFSLAQVRDHLLRIPDFGKFIDEQHFAFRATTRLIPVSAVGMKFADPQTNVIQQQKGIVPEPINIEIPLICVLPDILREQIDLLDKDLIRIKNPSVFPSFLLGLIVLFNLLTNKTLLALVFSVYAVQNIIASLLHQPNPDQIAASLSPLAEKANKSIADYNKINKKSPEVKRQKKIWRKRLRERQRIIWTLTKTCFSLAEKFDQAYPDAYLYRKKRSFFEW